VGLKDNAAYLQIGLRGRKDEFAALPPLNISFVIDISGSMGDQDKLSWVKDSFHIFIERVREQDFVSVVIFDDVAEVLIKPTHIRNNADRAQFRKQVDALRPRNGTNVYQGMTEGYRQVEANFHRDYTNRVLLLTDGQDGSGKSRKEFLDLNTRYKENGINISTIALGAAADINLMVDMAVAGGGSSRFISDHDMMEQTFGSDLDRLVVAAARNLEMELVLAGGVEFRETWGYSWWIDGQTIHYTLDTLHNGDYETIVAVADPGRAEPGAVLGNFSLSYTDTAGTPRRDGPFPLVLGRGPSQTASGLIADPLVREAEGYIALGKGLIELGNRAAGIDKVQREYTVLRNERVTALRQESPPAEGETLKVTDTSEMAVLRRNVVGELSGILKTVRSLKEYLNAVSLSFDGGKYAPELRILENYETSFTHSWEAYSKDE
jgi:hypothetical protein